MFSDIESPSTEQAVLFEPLASTPSITVVTCNRVAHSSAASFRLHNSSPFHLGASSPRKRSASTPLVGLHAWHTVQIMSRDRMEEEEVYREGRGEMEMYGGGVWGEEAMAERAQALYYQGKAQRTNDSFCRTDSRTAGRPYVLAPPDLDAERERMVGAMAGLASEGRYCEARELHQILGVPLATTSQQEFASNNAPNIIKHHSSQFQVDHLTAIRATKAMGCSSSRTSKRANSARRVRVSNNISFIPRTTKMTTRRSLLSSAPPFSGSHNFTPPLSEDEDSDCESTMHEGLTTPSISTLLANSATTPKSPHGFVARDSYNDEDSSSDEEDNEAIDETIILIPELIATNPTTRAAAEDEDALEAAEVDDSVSDGGDYSDAGTSSSPRSMPVDAPESTMALDNGCWDMAGTQHYSTDHNMEALGDDMWDDEEADDDADMSDTSSDVPNQVSPFLPLDVCRHFASIRSVDEVEEEALANAVSPVATPVDEDNTMMTEFIVPPCSTPTWFGGDGPAETSQGLITQLATPASFPILPPTHNAGHVNDLSNPPEALPKPASHAPFADMAQPFTTVPYSTSRKLPPVRSVLHDVASFDCPANSWKNSYADPWQPAPGCGPAPAATSLYQAAPNPATHSTSVTAYRNVVQLDSDDLEALADWFSLVVVTRLACFEPARTYPRPSHGGHDVYNLDIISDVYDYAGNPITVLARRHHLHGSRPVDPHNILWGGHIFSNSRIKANGALSLIILNIIESRCLSAEVVIAAAWHLERFLVHEVDGPEGDVFRRYLHARGPAEKYPLELRLAITAFMVAEIGVCDDQFPMKSWAKHTRISTQHLFNLQLSALESVGYSAVIQPKLWADHCESVYASIRTAGFHDVRSQQRLHGIMRRVVSAARDVVAQADKDWMDFENRPNPVAVPAATESPELAPVEMRKSRSYAEYDGATDFPAPSFDEETEDDDVDGATPTFPAQTSTPTKPWPVFNAHPTRPPYEQTYETAAAGLRSDLNDLADRWRRGSGFAPQQPNYSNALLQSSRNPPTAQAAPLTRWQRAPPLFPAWPGTLSGYGDIPFAINRDRSQPVRV